jgi:LPS-assembly lipoprotein
VRRLALLAVLVLAGCGFQLRGTADVPFQSIFVAGATGGIALDLKRQIEAGTRAKVLDAPAGADAILAFTQELRDKEILSLTGTGRVREFRLNYRVGFRLHDGKGGDFIAPNTIVLSRDVTFNDSEVLAKEAEEQLLFRDMQADMVSQIMRRIAAAPKPVARVK